MLKLILPIFQHFSDMKIYFKSRQITPYTVERDETDKSQTCGLQLLVAALLEQRKVREP